MSGGATKSVASLPPELGVAEPARPAPLDHVVHRARRAPSAAPVVGGPEPLAFDARVDGTRYLMFEPLELLETLAAITPRLGINLVLYKLGH